MYGFVIAWYNMVLRNFFFEERVAVFAVFVLSSGKDQTYLVDKNHLVGLFYTN